MFILLMLCASVLGVSVQRITSSEASRVLQELATKSCTVIACESAETRSQEIKELQRKFEELHAFIIKIANVILAPDGVVAGNKVYKTDRSAKGDFETAAAYCKDMGGIPASPRNPAENRAVQKIVALGSESGDMIAYLGITDMATEDKFQYLNGEDIQYSNWAPGEPNNVGNEDCTAMHPDGLWHDTDCGSMHAKAVVCEIQI